MKMASLILSRYQTALAYFTEYLELLSFRLILDYPRYFSLVKEFSYLFWR